MKRLSFLTLVCFSLVSVWLIGSAAAAAQGVASSLLTFSMDRSGPPLTQYSIRVDESSGRGFFQSGIVQSGIVAPGAAVTAAGGAPAAGVPITVSGLLVKKVFAAVPLVKSQRCDGHNKNIAQTGLKTLRYAQSGTVSECTYNYAADDRVNAATAVFEALAETMQYGERLSSKLRFDRLGLDGEMDNLQTALGQGRALEVGNIAPVLASIQNDDRVMERVRRKASHLLEKTDAGEAQGSGDRASSAR